MGLIGYLMPPDGIKTETFNLSFPSPINVMQEKELKEYIELVDINNVFWGHSALKHEIEEAQALAQASEYAKLRKKALKHQYSPSYPNNQIEWIFPLFEALEKAKEKKIRIIHYGDSQIEEDRMSNYLRVALQDSFGGYGVGLVPAIPTIQTASFGQKCSKHLTRYIVYGTQKMRTENGNYGPLGQTAHLTDSATFTFYKLNYRRTRPNTKYFNKITILLDEVQRTTFATLNVNGKIERKSANIGEKSITFYLPDSTQRASITMRGNALIYGFMIDGEETGVQLDNAAMRGCSGTIFTSISAESMLDYYTQNTVPMIIMQFGGNRVPYTKSNSAIATYCEQLTRQIKYLRKISPQSIILFIGPSDMSTNVNGQMTTYPHLEKFIAALRNMCLKNNVAYWDLYKAMGGHNSMIDWVNSTPQLAGSDHIHFTHSGSDEASRMLWEGIMQAYELYKIKE